MPEPNPIRLAEGLHALETLRVLHECSTQLVIESPHVVDPDDYMLPPEGHEAAVEARIAERRAVEPPLEEWADFRGLPDAQKRCSVIRHHHEARRDALLRKLAESDVEGLPDHRHAADRRRFWFAIFRSGEPESGPRRQPVPLDEVLRRARDAMQTWGIEVARCFAEEPPWGDRTDLTPQGGTLAEMRADYASIRNALLVYYARKQGRREVALDDGEGPYISIEDFEDGPPPDPVEWPAVEASEEQVAPSAGGRDDSGERRDDEVAEGADQLKTLPQIWRAHAAGGGRATEGTWGGIAYRTFKNLSKPDGDPEFPEPALRVQKDSGHAHLYDEQEVVDYMNARLKRRRAQ